MSIGPFASSCPNPSSSLIDPDATIATRCVWTTIQALSDGSILNGNVAIGQHLDPVNFHTRKPVSVLEAEVYDGVPAATPAVIGSEMGAFITHLDKNNTAGENIIKSNVKSLTADARAGRLVTVQWHARNPMSGGVVKDRTGVEDIGDILDETSATGRTWLSSTNKAISILQRLAANNVPVAWRPFHEPNISAFWWGKCDPAIYRGLWAQMQTRFEAAGLHNIIWLFGPNNRYGSSVLDPLAYLPDACDMITLDAYQFKNRPSDPPKIPLHKGDYDRILALGKPFGLAEVDVINDKTGDWPPSTVTDLVSTTTKRCAFAVFWWSYLGVDGGESEDKQSINDLVGHEAWWAQSVDGTMPTTR